MARPNWFVHFALYESLNLFDLTPSIWLASLVAAVAAGGIVLWLWHHATRPALYVALGLSLIPLSYLPNLLVKESWTFPIYRTQVALSALIALYFSLGALALWRSVTDWLEPRATPGVRRTSRYAAITVAITFVAGSAISAERNVDTRVAEPQMKELRLLRRQVAAIPANARQVFFVRSGVHERTVSPLSDEFGMPSSYSWYPADPIVLLILREQGRLEAPPPTVSLLMPWQASTIPRDGPRVDLNGLLRPG